MCGLYGIMGHVPNHKEVVTSLALKNQDRGSHSTGYADIFIKPNNFVIRKDARSAFQFKGQLKLTNGDIVIGHTRFATTGKICARNAHPWNIGNLIGAHNGVVMNEYSVADYMKEVHSDTASYEVDSQYLIHMLDRYGHMGNARGMLNVIYWDMRDKTLNFIIYNNPMHLAIDVNHHWLLWSSQKDHLEAVVKEHDLMGKVKISSLKEEMLTFELNNNLLYVATSEVPFDKEHRNHSAYGGADDDYGYYYQRGTTTYQKETTSRPANHYSSAGTRYVKVDGQWVPESETEWFNGHRVLRAKSDTDAVLCNPEAFGWPCD